jgi:hypothetical protein
MNLLSWLWRLQSSGMWHCVIWCMMVMIYHTIWYHIPKGSNFIAYLTSSYLSYCIQRVPVIIVFVICFPVYTGPLYWGVIHKNSSHFQGFTSMDHKFPNRKWFHLARMCHFVSLSLSHARTPHTKRGHCLPQPVLNLVFCYFHKNSLHFHVFTSMDYECPNRKWFHIARICHFVSHTHTHRGHCLSQPLLDMVFYYFHSDFVENLLPLLQPWVKRVVNSDAVSKRKHTSYNFDMKWDVSSHKQKGKFVMDSAYILQIPEMTIHTVLKNGREIAC